MAVTGTESRFQGMKVLAKELEVDGSPITGGVTQYTDAEAVAAVAAKTEVAALVSPLTDYADLATATAAIKSIIDALKA